MKPKKPFAALVELLEANQYLTIKQLMPEIRKLTHTNRSEKSKICPETGKLLIHCWAHDTFHDPKKIIFGLDERTSTGYANSCKIGLSVYTNLVSGIEKWAKAEREVALNALKESEPTLRLTRAGYVARLEEIDRITLQKRKNARSSLKC